MMACGECSLVSRNVAIGGGTVAAIRAIASSEITPGPLGMAETSPTAEAPQVIACAASAGDLIQQIFTRGRNLISRVQRPNVAIRSGYLLGDLTLIFYLCFAF
jgi:hypothetical protein